MERNLDEELRDVTRHHNRVLRTVNRKLRRAQERAQQQTDEIVAALFDAPLPDSPADIALRRIWEQTGKFCSPDDYEAIADTVIARHETALYQQKP